MLILLYHCVYNVNFFQVKNLNEQNDFVSSRMCNACVWMSLFMTVLMGVGSWVCIGVAIYYATQE